MRRADILSGPSFRTAVQAAILLSLVMIVVGVVVFAFVRDALITELEGQISEEVILFQHIYDTSGRAGLIAAVADLERHSLPVVHLTGLFEQSGARLSGNIPLAPDSLGWQRTELNIESIKGGAASIYVNAVHIDDMTMVVGRRLDLVMAASSALLEILLVSGLLATAGILCVGLFGSRSTLTKLQGMETTLARVSEGDLQARLPVSDAEDQIDRIAAQMNVHLDRLLLLVKSTRSTATAIAHDLKTPLSHAHLALQKALERAAKGDAPETEIEDALGELSRLNSIFDTILRLSRIQASRDQTTFAPFDLNALMKDVEEVLEPVADEKGQSLNVTPSPQPVTILGDERMIRQLLVNLVQNCLQHCPADTRITISAGSEDVGGAYLAVTDDGPGLPEGEGERVFEPFVRIDSARSTEGSGLGLALVKAIADRHRALIVLDPMNPGLRITVRFPDFQASTQS